MTIKKRVKHNSKQGKVANPLAHLIVVHRYRDPRYVARDGQNNYTRITRLIRYSLLGYSKGMFLSRGSPLNCRLPSWLRLLFFLQGIRLRVCQVRAASVSPHLPQIPNIYVWNLKLNHMSPTIKFFPPRPHRRKW